MSIPKEDERTPEPVVIEIIEGVAGSSLYINDQRVAGPKPWGGGRAVNRFEIAPDKIDQACNAYGSTDALRSALAELYHAVCGVNGFANAVREVSGIAYPWPALDIAEEKARAALSGSPAPSTEGLREALAGWDIEDIQCLRRMVPDLDAVMTHNPIAQVYFRAGLLACRETMARFVEQGGNPEIAASIRANWWPSLGDDPGAPRQLAYEEVADEKPSGRIEHADTPTSIEALGFAWCFLNSRTEARTALAGVTAAPMRSFSEHMVEELIVAAYKRGFTWANENPGDGEFIDKAARDYADYTMNSQSISGSPAPSTEGLREAARKAHDTLIEINPNNYTHDEVVALNAASVEAILLLADVLGERHGKTEQWWNERRTALAGVTAPVEGK